MSNTPHPESAVATIDRRLCVRRSVPSLAYVDLGKNNGGIILNLGEGGLAVTSVAPLDTARPAQIEIQLPGLGDRLVACGEVTWISESKKEAGLRFVNLSEEIRGRITNWMTSQESPPVDRGPAVGTQTLRSSPPIRSVKSAVTEFAGTGEAQQSAIATARAEIPSRREESVRHHNSQEQVTLDRHVAEPLQHPDRRMCLRRALPSLAYIDLGESNGGIILNLSEGGLTVTSAAPLYAEGVAQMQFQLPGHSDWLRVSGEIVWISRSKKEAGLRFVDLSEEVRQQIVSWISSKAPSIPFGTEGDGSRDKAWRRLEMPTLRQPLPSSGPPSKTMAPKPIPAFNAAPMGLNRAGVGFRAVDRPRKVFLNKTAWAILALVVILSALASFGAGWYTAVPDSLARILEPSRRTTSEIAATSSDVESRADAGAQAFAQTVSPSPDGPAVGLTGNATSSSASPTRAEGIRQDLTARDRANEDALATSAHQASPQEVRKPSSSNVTTNVSVVSPRGSGAPSNPVGLPTSAISLNQPPESSNAAAPASAPPLKPTENPESAKPSFSVNVSAYPSVRVPAGLKSQMSQQGARLEIGQLLSRVDPVYPEDAKAEHVEGTVKLHVVIGADGSVESVAPIGGPALLIPAAANAVQQWRYTESTIGGQPVEAEEDITITFRLPHSN